MLTADPKPIQFHGTMLKTVYKSSTPIKPLFDPVNKNTTATNNNMNFERIYPGIYLTSVKNLCSADDLKIYGFTHMIYIDKHIIEDTVIASTANTMDYSKTTSTSINQRNRCTAIHTDAITNAYTAVTASITIKYLPLTANIATETAAKAVLEPPVCCSLPPTTNISLSSTTSTSASASYQQMPVDDTKLPVTNENIYGHGDFETLDLNFGESSYLTTVLPNCYKAVKFIEKALKDNGAVLVIDCIGENQKCITIVIGFLMYKYNKNFLTAYQLIKRLHPNIELDKFFTTQLYEYEPILQVQRSQSGGNSCSRELRSALLKRKKTYDDCYYYHPDALMSPLLTHNPFDCTADNFINNIEQTADILMEQ